MLFCQTPPSARRASRGASPRRGRCSVAAMSRAQVTVEDERYESHATSADSEQTTETADLLETVRKGVLGDGCEFDGPFGPRPIVYADHTASGRALRFVESYIAEHVLPLYGNTHTTTSVTGRQSTLFRTEARDIVRRSVNAGARDVVLFVGNGVTGGINKLVHTLGLRRPGSLHGATPERLQRWRRTHSVQAYSYHNLPVKPDPEDVAARSASRPSQTAAHDSAGVEVVVFVGPFEHHSNILPWRESLARVVQIGEDKLGGIDAEQLEAHLQRESQAHGANVLLIGSFSAGSNVTGVVADTRKITVLLHKYGALSFWDFAAAGPHVKIDMNPSGTGSADSLDGAFISPHKFVGGPQCPGVLVLKRHIFDLSEPPEQAGGGTVLFVTEEDHRYLDDIHEREEAGTPAIVGAIRCGMVFQLHAAIGHARMQELEQAATVRVLSAWSGHPLVEVLGPKMDLSNPTARLPIISFMIRHTTGGRYLHYNFVCALLNDVFGIQSRGGCACAGPYGQAILGIDHETSRQFEERLVGANEIIRPGFVRVSFPYFFSSHTVDYIIRAVLLVADHGWRMLPQYRFYHETGEWKHQTDLKFRQRKWLQSISYATGELSIKRARSGSESASYPLQAKLSTMSESEQQAHLQDVLSQGEAIMSTQERSSIPPARDEARALDPQSEVLRWFVFPSEIAKKAAQSSNGAAASTAAANSEIAQTVLSMRPHEYQPGAATAALTSVPAQSTQPQSMGRERRRPDSEELSGSSSAKRMKLPSAAANAQADASTRQPTAKQAQEQHKQPAQAGTDHVSKAHAVHSQPPEAAMKRRKKQVEKKLMKLTGSAIKDYGMIREGDRILVGLSGGKDSLTLLQMLLALKRKAPIRFDVGVCTVDPMTEAFDPSPLKKYVTDELKLPYFFESQPIIDNAEKHMQRDSICAFCSRMKRGILYSCARRESYNVLALGQHLDDLAESFVMSAFNNGRLRTMKAHYQIEAGDTRVIRPFAYVREHMTREYAQLTTMPVIADNCPGCFNAPTERAHIKQLLAAEEERTPSIFSNMLKTIRPLMENDVDMEHTADAVSKRQRKEADATHKQRKEKGKGAAPAAAAAAAAAAGSDSISADNCAVPSTHGKALRPKAKGFNPRTGGFESANSLSLVAPTGEGTEEEDFSVQAMEAKQQAAQSGRGRQSEAATSESRRALS